MQILTDKKILHFYFSKYCFLNNFRPLYTYDTRSNGDTTARHWSNTSALGTYINLAL